MPVGRPWHDDEWSGRREVRETGAQANHLFEVLEREAARSSERIRGQVSAENRTELVAAAQVAVGAAVTAEAVARPVHKVAAQSHEASRLAFQIERHRCDIESALD